MLQMNIIYLNLLYYTNVRTVSYVQYLANITAWNKVQDICDLTHMCGSLVIISNIKSVKLSDTTRHPYERCSI